MTGLLIIGILVLIGIVSVQIGKMTELSATLRGEEEAQYNSNRYQALYGMIFLVGFLVFCVVSAFYYENWMLGYGPHESASDHGLLLDSIFNVTLFFTGIVFVVTHVLLFWFAYKFKGTKDRKALFIAHDNRLELIWTGIPAVVMAFLVIKGLVAWNEVMADVPEGEDHIEIEATGMQYAWTMRYPGPDGALGKKNFRLINPINALGQDWSDPKNLDDIVSSAPGEVIYLPKGKKVRVRITSRDVLHNFDLPHFRVKMDAIPGLPTYFVFTPNTTTEEYRERLGSMGPDGKPLYPEYHALSDPEDPDSPPLWESFNFELACAELCGKSHYSMKRVVEIVEPEKWERWMSGQNSYYLSAIRGTDEDPYKGKLLDVEIKQRTADFNSKVSAALAGVTPEEKTIRLDYVTFETGSANLTPLSKYELDNLVGTLKSNANITIEVAGHTDSVGNPDNNQTLSQARADKVAQYLLDKNIPTERFTSVGYGQNNPIESNETEEGRAQNRRTEFRILTQ